MLSFFAFLFSVPISWNTSLYLRSFYSDSAILIILFPLIDPFGCFSSHACRRPISDRTELFPASNFFPEESHVFAAQMWTKSMMRSLHKLTGWLRRFYTRNGPRESHPRQQSPSNNKKLESRTSSDTETECVQHHTIVKASTMAPRILDSDSPTRTRIGIPESEEYDKMIAELP